MNIAIIGAGELGSRHLQAFALHDGELNLFVVDPSQESLRKSKNRFDEVDKIHNKKLHFTQTIESLPNTMDFVVIATNSIQRLEAIKALLNHSQVKFLLLEKFLFPHLEEYKIAENLLSSHKVQVYVNCPRRVFPIYQEIRKSFKGDKNISISVTGVKWNLASNAVHFLDLFSFLTGTSDFDIYTDNLDQELLKNKRQGYIEFSGSITVLDKEGSEMKLTSYPSGEMPMIIKINSDNKSVTIDENKEELTFGNNEKEYTESFSVFKQSELTHKIFESLIIDGQCELVNFMDSSKIHQNLLKAFNEFLGERIGVIT